MPSLRKITFRVFVGNFIGRLSIQAIVSNASIRIKIHPFIIWLSIQAITSCIPILKSHFPHPTGIVVLRIPSRDTFKIDIRVTEIGSFSSSFPIWPWLTQPWIRINCTIVTIRWTERKISSGSSIP